jgi:hypothetical protein
MRQAYAGIGSEPVTYDHQDHLHRDETRDGSGRMDPRAEEAARDPGGAAGRVPGRDAAADLAGRCDETLPINT